MHILSGLTVLGACLLIIFQDFGKRLIHIGSLLLLIAGLIAFNLQHWSVLYKLSLINCAFVIILLAIIKCYIFIRKRDKKFVDRYIGSGDIAAFFVFCIGYDLYNFIVLILLGCICCLIYQAAAILFYKKTVIRLPLAGALALTHIVTLLFSFFYLHNVNVNLL